MEAAGRLLCVVFFVVFWLFNGLGGVEHLEFIPGKM